MTTSVDDKFNLFYIKLIDKIEGCKKFDGYFDAKRSRVDFRKFVQLSYIRYVTSKELSERQYAIAVFKCVHNRQNISYANIWHYGSREALRNLEAKGLVY